MDKKNKEISISDLLNILRVRWLVILISGIVLAAAAFGYTKLFITPQYMATAQLFVDTRRESSEGKDTYIQSSHIAAAKALADTYVYLIETNTILDKVIDDLDLETGSKALASKISVKVVDETQILMINVYDADPKVAYRIVTKLVEIAPDNINAKVDSGKLISIDNPSVTSAPVSPNTARNTVIGFVAGFVLVYGFLLVKKLLDNKFRSAEEIQQTFDLPVLGVIPSIDRISSK